MTTSYVIDSWTWIEYLDATKYGLAVKDIIEKNENSFTSAISVSEVISKLSRHGKDPEQAYIAISTLSRIVEIDVELAKKVGFLYSQVKRKSPNFGLADAFVLQTAMSLGAKVMTGDPDFKGLKDVVMLK